MMYPYMILADETEITHSQVLENGDTKEVEVHFERPTSDGFASARCTLPSYKWLKNEGFSAEEIGQFEQYLHSNAHLLFKYAEGGGLSIA